MPQPLSAITPISHFLQLALASACTAAALLAPGTALAVEDSPCLAFGVLSHQSGATVEHWLGALGACQNDASFLATLGDLLNQQGRYQEASEHLERALLLRPELKGAQISYAIALAGVGDAEAAQALLDALLGEPDLPAHLRSALQKQKEWQRTPVLQTRFTLNARWGRDSNLLSAPNLSEMALTLSGQSVVLPLDASYLAHAGQYYRTDAQFELRRLQPNGTRWDLAASLHNRYSPVEVLAGANQLDVMLERSTAPVSASPAGAAPGWGNYLSAAASGLAAHVGTRYESLSLAGGAVLAWNKGWAASCRTRLGAELQLRNYENNNLLSARYTGFTGSLACEPPLGRQWLVGLKAGQDRPRDSDRPGGDQNQYSLRAAGVWPLVPGLLNADFEIAKYADSNGYSALLESGRTRTMTRYSTRLEYQHPIARSSHWVIGLEAARQKSNLELFQLQSAGPYLAWRASW